jgi:hypothetical protein
MNISGLIGRQTGIFKTSLGIQIALNWASKYKLHFDVRTNLAFTSFDLNEKIKEFGGGKRDQIWILDERGKDNKVTSLKILQNVIEACREKRFCFILIGVDETLFTISDYKLERIGESDDKFLPKKTVYYAVSKEMKNRRYYRGFYRYNIIPLTDKKWNHIWNNLYMPQKTSYEERAINQDVTGIDINKLSVKIIENKDFINCIIGGKLKRNLLRTLIYDMFKDRTHDERELILNRIAMKYNAIQDSKPEEPQEQV